MTATRVNSPLFLLHIKERGSEIHDTAKSAYSLRTSPVQVLDSLVFYRKALSQPPKNQRESRPCISSSRQLLGKEPSSRRQRYSQHAPLTQSSAILMAPSTEFAGCDGEAGRGKRLTAWSSMFASFSIERSFRRVQSFRDARAKSDRLTFQGHRSDQVSLGCGNVSLGGLGDACVNSRSLIGCFSKENLSIWMKIRRVLK